MGNSDRFSIGYAMMRCWLVDKPWDCHPSNALEDLLWKPVPRDDYPNFRWYDTFWMKELDLQAHGSNLLWRLITENTDIQCMQQKPLFPFDPESNPIVCALPAEKPDVLGLVVTGLQIGAALLRQHMWEIVSALVAGAGGWLFLRRWRSNSGFIS
jgi:peroxidase